MKRHRVKSTVLGQMERQMPSAEEIKAAFVKCVGPMTINMGCGRDIASYAYYQARGLRVWQAAVKWAREASSVLERNESHPESLGSPKPRVR